MKKPLLFILLVGIISCSNPTVQEDLNKVQAELATAKSTIENLKSQIEPEGKLVHIVFFKLKTNVDLVALGNEIKKLEAIEVIKDLQFGFFENLDDTRALSDYDLMMEMSFDDKEAYKKYQAHPIHLALKENVKSFLAGPPATYDYLKK